MNCGLWEFALVKIRLNVYNIHVGVFPFHKFVFGVPNKLWVPRSAGNLEGSQILNSHVLQLCITP